MAISIPQLPAEVLDYVRSVFSECKLHAAQKMSRMPTTHETSLDLTIIEAISQFSAPQFLGDEWLVQLETHYLGGARHFGQWEIADIGFIVVIRDRGEVHTLKIALLQSKRLYPDQQILEEDTPEDYMIGFRRLMQLDDPQLAAQQERDFSFSASSQYRALIVDDQQFRRIKSFETARAIPVHYLLHHPLELPWSQTIPLAPGLDLQGTPCRLGATVRRAGDIRSALSQQTAGYTPTFEDLEGIEGWPIDAFVADELLGCREGYVAGSPSDEGLFQVFNARTGPIAAAIAITIDKL